MHIDKGKACGRQGKAPTRLIFDPSLLLIGIQLGMHCKVGRTHIISKIGPITDLPFFKSEVTFANFQIDGKLLASMERLKSDVTVGATTSTVSLSKRGLILSRQTALFGLSCLIALMMKSVETETR